MKGIACLVTVLAFSGTVAGATVVDTARYEIDKLIIDHNIQAVAYDTLERIADPGSPALPFDRRTYRLARWSQNLNPGFRVIRADTIALARELALAAADLTTSSAPRGVASPRAFAEIEGRYPGTAVQIMVQRLSGAAVVAMTLFPVQVLSPRKIIFNREIELSITADEGEAPESGYPCSTVPGGIGAAGKVTGATAGGCPLGQEVVIVTSPLLAEAAMVFLELKLRCGFDAALAVTDSIYAQYAGVDRAEALRHYLVEFYQRGGRAVILAGGPSQVPIRYLHHYNVSEPPDLYDLIPSDLYYGDVDGEWDVDGDGIWGEPTQDRPDIASELAVGRLPFSHPDELAAYVRKLESYLFNPGGGDVSYLGRAVFFCSDQMRDYFEGGQQYRVAENFPEGFAADCERLAEAPTGSDPAPVGPTDGQAIGDLSDGYGLVNILAHGRPDGFVVNASLYNEAPKMYLLTGRGRGDSSSFTCMSRNNRIGFYYSIACDQAGLDLDLLYGMPVPSAAQELLALDSAGPVGLMAFTRWGWVGSSYRLMAAFYAHLFGDADGYPAAAMNLSRLDYYYYRDQIYGQNYFGDPTIRLYRELPARVVIEAPSVYESGRTITLRLSCGGAPLVNSAITIASAGNLELHYTDGSGQTEVAIPDGWNEALMVTAYVPGWISAAATIEPSLTAGVGDTEPALARVLSLDQNFPNPFNPTTVIGFALARSGQVRLEIFDILGRRVAEPVNRPMEAGSHTIVWDGRADSREVLASGIYLYRLTTASGSLCRRMVLLK